MKKPEQVHTMQNKVPKLKIYTHARKNQLLLDEPIVLKFIDAGTNETINETICAFYDIPEWESKLMWSDQGCWLDYEKEGKHLTPYLSVLDFLKSVFHEIDFELHF